jgi:TPR repeat protein
LLRDGRGVAQDEAAAFQWYTKAAGLGHAEAMYNLGICYAEGRGIAQDWTAASQLYKKAAELGDADAMSLVEAG